MKYIKEISKEEIKELPLLKFGGKIHLITSAKDMKRAVKTLKNETVLGFDTETRASFRKGEFYHVSMLQLATETEVFLFRLNFCPLSKELADILASNKIIKAGVAVHDDIKGLQKLVPFEKEGFVDLAQWAKELEIKTFSLNALTAIFLGHRLSKKAKISNWELPRLSQMQIEYAALDAWVGHQIYLHMKEIKALNQAE